MNKTIVLLLTNIIRGLGFTMGPCFPALYHGIGEYIALAEIVEIKQAKKEIVKDTSLSMIENLLLWKLTQVKKNSSSSTWKSSSTASGWVREILKHKLAELTYI